MRERFPRLVTVSLLMGRLSLVVLRWSGLPDTACADEAQTPPQKFAMALGAFALRLNRVGIGHERLEASDA